MLAVVSSGALQGIDAISVQVEVNTGESGEPRMILVGLPGAAVKESNDRVVSAITNSGWRPPTTRTTINLAPGSIRKEGPVYDLPIALGIPASTGQLTAPRLGDYLIAGELSLSGKTRPIKGALPLALLAKEEGKPGLILPPVSAEEAALVETQPVYKVHSLDEAVLFLSGKKMLPRVKPTQYARPGEQDGAIAYERDFSEIRGQQNVRRAVEIAVTGGHNLLMIGPPGSGKSMISKRIPTIFPDPTMEEFLEILSIHSASGSTLNDKLKPFERPW